MEPNPKRYRSGNSWFGSNPRVLEQLGGGGVDQCRRFNTPEGCPFGSACRFRHVSADGRDIGSHGLSSGGKPKPCMKFFSTTGCQFGESCHFLHYVPGDLSSLGPSPIVSLSAAPVSALSRKPVAPFADPSTGSGYKTKLCNRFNTAEGCRFGNKCHFAHGESDLRLPNNQSEGNIQRAQVEVSGNGAPWFGNGGSDVSNQGTFGNMPSLKPQVAVSDSSAKYGVGSIGENLQVY